MKKYLKITKLKSFFDKYGFMGPYYVFKWLYAKRKFALYAKQFSKIDNNTFKVNNIHTNFEDFYTGNLLTEAEKIIKGERKILFYNVDDANREFDIKTRWEMNRMHHLPILALSTKNQVSALAKIHKDLQHENLEKVFLNTNSMEVAIAAVNSITAYKVLQQNDVDIEFDINLFLKKSVEYILSNIEVGIRYSNNHYFFNLIGLLWITENIVGNKMTDQLKQTSYFLLNKLLEQIVNQDGSLYEGTTYYHKYVTDSLLIFLALNKSAQKNINLMNFAAKMYRFCCYASFDNELIGIGDNDSGRLLPTLEYFNYKSSSLLLTHKLAKKLNITYSKGNVEELLLGINLSNKTSFGLFKLQSQNWKAAIRCDQLNNKWVNKKIGSHSHNDQLSVLVNFKDEKLFVDSGTYSYIKENNFRKKNILTSAHNTLNLDNKEQNIIHNDWRYTERRARGKISNCTQRSFEGVHYGYLDFGIVHSRYVEVNETLIIKDTINKKEDMIGSGFSILYHIHPSFSADISKDKEVVISNGIDKLLLKVIGDCQIEIVNTTFSQEYGKKDENSAIVIRGSIQKNENEKSILMEIGSI